MARVLGYEFHYTGLTPEERQQRRALAFLGVAEKDFYVFTAKNRIDRAACGRIFRALTQCCQANGEMSEANMNLKIFGDGDPEAEARIQKAEKAYWKAQSTLKETIAKYDDLRIEGWDVRDLVSLEDEDSQSPVYADE